MREGSLEVKFPTIWTDGKAEGGRVREEKVRRKKTREKSQKKEDFQCFVAQGGLLVAWHAQGILHLATKRAKREGFCSNL